jgi:hypothetical protein
MAVPTTNVGLTSIQTEFGGSNPIQFQNIMQAVLLFLVEHLDLLAVFHHRDKFQWEYLEEL